ncbi:MAG: bifunctional diaminohydroxyphosphoribosylaminopyrimidine deaminase/5-amino-6-(5-phosphoribosylamino)uracil reductase RibD [Chthoniobacterales bacterium]
MRGLHTGLIADHAETVYLSTVDAHVDQRFMRLALTEAHKGVGATSPNPAVGAVLVSAGKIVARGHHEGAGQPHAEVTCLQSAKVPIRKGSVLYVTLEPCSTTGRTPPCTQAIIDAGIKEVVVGAVDVNPRHAGRGLELLRAAGIKVRVGILEHECIALNEAFNHWIQTKRPFVIAKCGMSLDGRLTRPDGESQWITSEAAREHANRMRSEVDAILVGAETVRQDNPRLTVRAVTAKRQPWRIILTRSEKLPKRSHIFTDRFADRTLVFRDKKLRAVLKELGKREITSVLIEGGGDVLGQALDARLIDRLRIYLGPLLTGGPTLAFGGRGAGCTAEAARLLDPIYEKVGSDLYLTGKPIYGNPPSE